MNKAHVLSNRFLDAFLFDFLLTLTIALEAAAPGYVATLAFAVLASVSNRVLFQSLIPL